MHNKAKNTFQNIKPLQCDILDDVTLLPMVGHIAKQTNTYALGAFSNSKPLAQAHHLMYPETTSLQLPYIKPTQTLAQEVIYGGIFFTHWGHFLIDTLQRLWYAKGLDLPIVWVATWGEQTKHEVQSWQVEIFKNLGIHNTHIFLKEPTNFSKVHFPEPGFSIYSHLHPQHVEFLSYHEEPVTSGKYVYFSRANYKGCVNEKHVEAMLRKRGWQIVYPETLSVEKQLSAISSAEVCLMIAGSAQHSMLFTKELQTRIVIIPRIHTTQYELIAHHKSDNYFLLDVIEDRVCHRGNACSSNVFMININALSNILDETQNLTTNLSVNPEILTQVQKLSNNSLQVPETYYNTPKPPTKARKLFYHAIFLYQKHKYQSAYKICMHLKRKGLLEESMYHDYFTIVQMHHLIQGLSITSPLTKIHHKLAILQAAISAGDVDSKLYREVAHIYLSIGMQEKAIDIMLQLIDLYPNWSEPCMQLADFYEAMGNINEAIIYGQHALAKDPDNISHTIKLVKYLCKQKDYKTCKKLLTQILMHDRINCEAYIALADVHAADGAIDKAIATAQKAVEIAPKNLAAHDCLARYLYQQGDHSAAVKLISKTIKYNQRAGERYAQCAQMHFSRGNISKAIDYAYKAVEAEPSNFICKNMLATYLLKDNQYAAMQNLIEQALHDDPFWSEAYVKYAAMHDAKGELDNAIDCARKAVAINPHNAKHREELELYRIKKIKQTISENELWEFVAKRYIAKTLDIQLFIDMFYATTYLEIGVYRGDTFLSLDVPFKIGVDPKFCFDVEQHANENTIFYNETSDTFFENFEARAKTLGNKYHNKPFKFDVIFIDGLHTYEQTLRDFENSLTYSHDKTIWIFDDTIPSHQFSAMPSIEKHDEWKKCAGLSRDIAWYGDVFKVIFAIHDKFPEFSYCTQTDDANSYTILWRTEKPSKRSKVFDIGKNIVDMRYEDFVDYAWVVHPVSRSEIVNKIFTTIDPIQYKTDEEYKKVIRPLVTDEAKDLHKENKNLYNQISILTEHTNSLLQENSTLQERITVLETTQVVLERELAVLQDKIKNFS